MSFPQCEGITPFHILQSFFLPPLPNENVDEMHGEHLNE